MSTSNSLLNPTVIGKELLMRFKNNLGFVKTIDNEYDDRFDKIGDTYNLREGARFVANDGADVTSAIQDVNESSLALTIGTQKNVAFKFSAKDLKLTIDRFGERYLEGAAIALANKFESDLLTRAYQKVSNFVGTPGTGITSMQVVLDAGVKLDDHSAPVSDTERYLTVNPASQAKAVNALSGLFQSANELGSQYRKGRMGHALGFDWGMAQNIRTHTNGTAVVSGAGLVNGTSQGALGTIVTDTWTAAATITAGTVITISGVSDVNPVSGDTLPYAKQIVVTADATADGTGNATLTIGEALVASGPTKNCSALPANNAPITIVSGAVSTGYAQNLAYHRQAFAFAMVPPQVPMGVHFAKTSVDADSGISIRFITDYLFNTDEFATRADIMYGFVVRRPSWACRVTG